VVESCGKLKTAKFNKLDPGSYPRDILARIADHPVRRVDELLPWCWARPSANPAV
jgi:hypothetical protein